MPLSLSNNSLTIQPLNNLANKLNSISTPSPINEYFFKFFIIINIKLITLLI